MSFLTPHFVQDGASWAVLVPLRTPAPFIPFPFLRLHLPSHSLILRQPRGLFHSASFRAAKCCWRKLNLGADCFHYIVMMSHLRWAFTDTGNPFAPPSTASSHCTASVPNLCNFLKSTLIKNILNTAYQALQNVAPSHPRVPSRALLPLAVPASGHTDTFNFCLVLLDPLFTAV